MNPCVALPSWGGSSFTTDWDGYDEEYEIGLGSIYEYGRENMLRLMRRLKAVDRSGCSAVTWTRANIGEVLPGLVTPLTWSVFRANLLRQPLSKVEAESNPNGPIRLIEGRAYLRLDALLGSFCYLPGVGPHVVCQALGVDQEIYQSDGWKTRGNLLAQLSGGLFLAEALGLSPVLWLKLARLGTPPLGESQPGESDSTSSPALVRRIEGLIDWNTRCFQLHLKCTRYAIGAYGLLIYMLRHWLPTAGMNSAPWRSNRAERETNFATSRETYRTSLEAELLSIQAELQSAEQGLALWRLAEQARAHPSVAAVLEDEVNWTAAQRALQAVEGGPEFLEALAAFLSRHGARTVEEFELASSRWREDPTFVLTVMRNYLHADAAFNPKVVLRQHRAFCDIATARIVRQMGSLRGRLFRRVLRAYKTYVPLRENMKYRLMEGYEALRHSFLKLGNCLCTIGILDSKEDIFFLAAGEALAAGRDGAVNAEEIRTKVNHRRTEWACQERFQPPEVIIGNDLAWALDDNGMGTLQGIGCSPGYAVGKARVIRDIAMASHLQPGEILVAPSTDPGWTPLFLTAAAVVTDIGGFLSHGATVAREYGIPAVVNTKRASELVKNGQVIIVDGNQGIVYLSPGNLFETKQGT
jgi:phosphohistidine swiveling domain-containing protein